MTKFKWFMLIGFAALVTSCKVVGVYDMHSVKIKKPNESEVAVSDVYFWRDQTVELEFGGTMIYHQSYRGCCQPINYDSERVGYWKKRGDTLILEYAIGNESSYLVTANGDSLFPITRGRTSSYAYVKR